MAIDILSIPAMSDDPERVFSCTRRTVSWDRARLTPETIEKSQCLSSWVKNDLIRRVYGSAEDEIVDVVMLNCRPTARFILIIIFKLNNA